MELKPEIKLPIEMSQKVDFLGKLPPEIAMMILEQLPERDLWSCLSLSRQWRMLGNNVKLWKRHLLPYDADPYRDSTTHDSFILCSPAKTWVRIQASLNNWKQRRFKELVLPTQLQEPLFTSFGENLAALEPSMTIKVFSVLEDSVHPNSNIVLPLTGIPGLSLEEGELIMWDTFLIYKNRNILIVYRKEIRYIFHSIFFLDFNGNMHVAIEELVACQILSTSFGSDVCEFSYLYDNRLWVSYTLQNYVQFHYLINLEKLDIKRIIPPITDTVVHFSGFQQRVIFAYAEKIIAYDIDGKLLMLHDHCCNYIQLSCNNNVIAVLDEHSVSVYDILSGEEVVIIENDFFMPSFYLSPTFDVLYLSKNLREKYLCVSAFDIRSKINCLLWVVNIPLTIGASHITRCEFIHGVFLFVFIEFRQRECVLVDKIYLIDTRTKQTTCIGDYYDINHVSKNFIVRGHNPVSILKT